MKPTWVRPSLVVLAAGFALAVSAVVLGPKCGCCIGAAEPFEAGVWGAAFWPRLFATVLPFAVLSGVVALIYIGPPATRQSDRTREAGRGTSVIDEE
jgi:hypothetical protein